MVFMNYGWEEIDSKVEKIPLNNEDEQDRYCIQLYHEVCSAIDMKGKDVLEVGCGRGGGASYNMRYLHPKSLVGVDLAKAAIRFCNKYYNIPDLSFVRDNAESLHFPDNSFDTVVNIESSHCYPSLERFFQSVYRVLRSGGYFLYADFWHKEQTPIICRQLESTGFTVLKEINITPQVLNALDLDNERKQKLIEHYVPKILRSLFNEFAGMKGTQSAYKKLKSGEMKYVRFVLKKNNV